MVGIFYDHRRAESAYAELRLGGFRDDQIRVSLGEADLKADFFAEEDRGRAHLLSGAALGGLLAMTAAMWLPLVAPVFAVALLLRLLVGAVVGVGVGLVVAGLGRRGGPAGKDAPRERVVHLSRGIVTVRPEGRDEEAAGILRHYAGCPAGPVPGAWTEP